MNNIDINLRPSNIFPKFTGDRLSHVYLVHYWLVNPWVSTCFLYEPVRYRGIEKRSVSTLVSTLRSWNERQVLTDLQCIDNMTYQCCGEFFEDNVKLNNSPVCCMKPPVHSGDGRPARGRWDLPYPSFPSCPSTWALLPLPLSTSSLFAIEANTIAVKRDGRRRRRFVTHGRVAESIFHELRSGLLSLSDESNISAHCIAGVHKSFTLFKPVFLH